MPEREQRFIEECGVAELEQIVVVRCGEQGPAFVPEVERRDGQAHAAGEFLSVSEDGLPERGDAGVGVDEADLIDGAVVQQGERRARSACERFDPQFDRET
ncbi:hypothetical protein C5C45_00450 [Rathayibacter rathayi]|uniref:Uncharacterized protein n=1 Tax=Rathayibacter rathayi TaxID=33887 RepID=A0ABX5AIN0_RATRA|nr:hypothetical protein [Rathayibacter rathayi]PPF24276.1 hypothetical protein C5C34_05965 [Rathayibacter rathayi]PPF51597.1 hypothetical protein C5C08_01955 [Rathayibacter rathayi]PPF83188.1 hypothetical protein C5C14_01995 [Rathayibacter rathayi]PPG47018.1 hypothetical protein C5C20_01950 [Rathayibacter rathayi]PPG96521.1 hypothetical protein C5C22_02575 [Rathayibacter rathayi]